MQRHYRRVNQVFAALVFGGMLALVLLAVADAALTYEGRCVDFLDEGPPCSLVGYAGGEVFYALLFGAVPLASVGFCWGCVAAGAAAWRALGPRLAGAQRLAATAVATLAGGAAGGALTALATGLVMLAAGALGQEQPFGR